MKQIYPDYYPEFHCLAGGCPDTCCKAWEVVVDQDALAFYKTVKGTLGEKLQQAFSVQDGQTCFRLREDGMCCLLTEDGLCPLQAEFGERGLCQICASHPRFFEEYGATQEITLSISCPEAARLLLEHPEPIRLEERQTDESVDTPNSLDPELYFTVRGVRDTMLQLIQDRSRSIQDRLSLTLLLAVRVQRLLDGKHMDSIRTLCTRFLRHGVQERQLLRLRRLRGRKADFFPMWLLLRNMEHLTTEFPALLERSTHAQRPSAELYKRYNTQLENLSVYFLFRYVLKASVDGMLLEKTGACIFHVLAIFRLFSQIPEHHDAELQKLCSLYSKEVEHSEENLTMLYRSIRHRGLRADTLLSLI